MALDNIRLEVMNTVEKEVDGFIEKYLIPVEEIWQPTDLLPNLQGEDYMNELTQIREEAKELEYDFWVVLVADMVTEEALPTYESWLMDMEGVKQHGKSRGEENAWSKWVRHWTGEENRHGDTLNKYLYLSGRVNMREIEKTTQHLINDGFDFIYKYPLINLLIKSAFSASLNLLPSTFSFSAICFSINAFAVLFPYKSSINPS